MKKLLLFILLLATSAMADDLTVDKLTAEEVSVINYATSTTAPFDVKNRAMQGQAGAPNTLNLHGYTDAVVAYIDNVSDHPAVVIRNTGNSYFRADKPSNYVGNGKYLIFSHDNYGGEIWAAYPDGEFIWSSRSPQAKLWRDGLDAGSPAFTMQTSQPWTESFGVRDATGYFFTVGRYQVKIDNLPTSRATACVKCLYRDGEIVKYRVD
ncbi:MAG: hypothetical protein GWN00_27800 [Aliifodinibius sp.]|nr:hypothetical protein [candidate division Zixibacteria bacterium]NIT59886.1 hypothetical protein [Fodinibius sp.]NIV14607.1 hypothetical protein [Fodinibius sp.]NIY28469.1 hypothetical protein [Fodinibius sp.]